MRFAWLPCICLLGCGSGSGQDNVVPPDAQITPPTADAGPTGPTTTLVAEENKNPGTGAWSIGIPAMAREIEAYADAVSAPAGTDIHVAVSTGEPTFSYQVFRTGSYGGKGGRLMATGGPLVGALQPDPTPDPTTGLVQATWTPTFTIATHDATNAPWMTGVYLVLLTAERGEQSYVVFILRDDTRVADVAVQLSTATWQAYNAWGGESLYASALGLSGGKARMVSYDRPYEAAMGYGAGLYVSKEMPLVEWLESKGYDVEYVTNLDTGGVNGSVAPTKVFISVGHDEYATLDAMNRLAAARDAGTSLIFLSGDTMYWQVRYDAAGRLQTCYKDQINEDPYLGVDDSRVTTEFRLPPVNHPEDGLLGIMSSGEANGMADWIVQGSGHWIYAGTGLHDGDAIANLVGYEWDTYFGQGTPPAPVTILAASPIVGGMTMQNASIYETPKAFVFAAGSIDFCRHLDDSRVAGMLTNLLTHAGALPPSMP